LLGYFWKVGFLDGSRAKNLHQASYILDNLSAEKINKVLITSIKKHGETPHYHRR